MNLARIRQKGMSVIMHALPEHQQVLEGDVRQIIPVLKKRQIHRVLLVTTRGTLKRGLADGLIKGLLKDKIEVIPFTSVHPDPTDINVEQCAATYRDHKCQAILALGGGSVMDCAKAASLQLAAPVKGKLLKETPFLVAVPTTAGTGSEATAGAVITQAREHKKVPVNDLRMIPDVAVLDVAFTETLPRKMTADTAMDALSHGIEAYTNRFAGEKGRKEAKEAVKKVLDNVETAYETNDEKARKELLKGAYLAGKALNQNHIGNIHALSHAIGSRTGLPHGQINAVLMPVVLEKYGKTVEKDLAELARYAGITKEENDQRAASAFISRLKELNRQFGIPEHLQELKAEDVDWIAAQAAREGENYPSPQLWSQSEMKEILKQVMA